jgi:hypothetical protein
MRQVLKGRSTAAVPAVLVHVEFPSEAALCTSLREGVFSETGLPVYGVLGNSIAAFKVFSQSHRRSV